MPDAADERVTDSTATTPLAIGVVFIALMMHMLFAQLIDFPAELAAEPTAVVTDWTVLGTFRVHCSPAGWSPEELMLRFRDRAARCCTRGRKRQRNGLGHQRGAGNQADPEKQFPTLANHNCNIDGTGTKP